MSEVKVIDDQLERALKILKKIAAGSCDELGDISTLADPEVIEGLVKNRIQGKL